MHNPKIFNAAFSGALSGALTNRVNFSSYANIIATCLTFAYAVDNAIALNPGGISNGEQELLNQLSRSALTNCYPSTISTGTTNNIVTAFNTAKTSLTIEYDESTLIYNPIYGDGEKIEDGTILIGDTTLTSPTATWIQDDIGKIIKIVGAGAGGTNLLTTISNINNNHSIEIATPALSGVVNALVIWGTENGGPNGPLNIAISTATSTGKKLVIIPGNYIFANPVYDTTHKIPSNTHIEGLLYPKLISVMPYTGAHENIIFHNVYTAAPGDTTLHANNVVGTDQIVVHNNIAAGVKIRLVEAALATHAEEHTIKITGAGPGPTYTLTLERPSIKQFVAGDAVQIVTSRPENVIIEGVYFSGSGDSYLDFFEAENCIFRNIKSDTEWDFLGNATGNNAYAICFNIGSYNCKISECNLDMSKFHTGVQLVDWGICLATCEYTNIYDCNVLGAQNAGISFYECEGCFGYGNTTQKCAFGTYLGTEGGTYGCGNCAIIGGSNIACGSGLVIAKGTHATSISNVTVKYCTGAGVNLITNDLLTGIKITSCNITNNADIGILVGGSHKGTIIENTEVTGNLRGMTIYSPTKLVGISCASGCNTSAIYFGAASQESSLIEYDFNCDGNGCIVIDCSQTGRITIDKGYINMTGNNSFGVYNRNGSVVELGAITFKGNDSCYGYYGINGSTLRKTGKVRFDTIATHQFDFQSAAAYRNCGYFDATGAVGVNIAFPDIIINSNGVGDRIFVTRTVDGGTPGNTPKVEKSAGVGIIFTADALDTSRYDYYIY